jgi:hypothetical protein
VCFENCCGVDLLIKQISKLSLEVQKRDLMKKKVSSFELGLQTRAVEVQTSRSTNCRRAGKLPTGAGD